jgi:hypothetical protein
MINFFITNHMHTTTIQKKLHQNYGHGSDKPQNKRSNKVLLWVSMSALYQAGLIITPQAMPTERR